jgi:hypothetical protein
MTRWKEAAEKVSHVINYSKNGRKKERQYENPFSVGR